MRKFIIQAVLLLIIIATALIFFSPSGNSLKLEIPFIPQPTLFKTLDIKGNKIKVEIADTDSKRNKGLSNRDFLDQGQGMLFVYPKVGSHPFWMKNMRFPLDFIWISKDKVVDIIPGVAQPPAGAKDADLVIYTSRNDADKVLEVNTGVISKLDIKVGDIIKIE